MGRVIRDRSLEEDLAGQVDGRCTVSNKRCVV